jgi:hypothetical protein
MNIPSIGTITKHLKEAVIEGVGEELMIAFHLNFAEFYAIPKAFSIFVVNEPVSIYLIFFSFFNACFLFLETRG